MSLEELLLQILGIDGGGDPASRIVILVLILLMTIRQYINYQSEKEGHESNEAIEGQKTDRAALAQLTSLMDRQMSIQEQAEKNRNDYHTESLRVQNEMVDEMRKFSLDQRLMITEVQNKTISEIDKVKRTIIVLESKLIEAISDSRQGIVDEVCDKIDQILSNVQQGSK